MDSLGNLDYTGLSALIAAVGHIIYTMYRAWKQKQIAKIDEESETIIAQAGYLESIATSAATMINTAEARVTYLSEQLGQLQVDYTILRQTLMSTQDIVAALKTDNRRLTERVLDLEKENRLLKGRLAAIEDTNGLGGVNHQPN